MVHLRQDRQSRPRLEVADPKGSQKIRRGNEPSYSRAVYRQKSFTSGHGGLFFWSCWSSHLLRCTTISMFPTAHIRLHVPKTFARKMCYFQVRPSRLGWLYFGKHAFWSYSRELYKPNGTMSGVIYRPCYEVSKPRGWKSQYYLAIPGSVSFLNEIVDTQSSKLRKLIVTRLIPVTGRPYAQPSSVPSYAYYALVPLSYLRLPITIFSKLSFKWHFRFTKQSPKYIHRWLLD